MQNNFQAKPLQRRFSGQGQTLIDAFRRTRRLAAGSGVQSGFDDATGFVSHRSLLQRAHGVARIVGRLSKPGQTIGLLLPNVAGTVAALLGIGAIGRIPALLNYSVGPDVLRKSCEISRVGMVMTSRAFVEKAGLQHLIEAIEPPIYFVEDLRGSMGIADKLWVLFSMLLPGVFFTPGKGSDTAVILFTSGSEGIPKAVALSHDALLSNVDQILNALDVGPRHVLFNALPVFHSFGLTAGALLPLFVGMRSVLYVSPLHFKEIPKLIAEHRATIVFGTSSFLAQYARHAEPNDFKTLEIVVAGAERLADEVREVWQRRFGLDIYEGYGCTETAPVLAVNLPNAQRAGSVGRLVAGLEAQLVEVPSMPGQFSLHVRGPNLMTGYLSERGQPERPSTSLGSDWYDTGDIVRIDEDGFIFIEGRAKRFAKIAGEGVSLAWTERIACRAYPEAEHAAARAPDAHRGERIILFTTHPNATREDLIRAAHLEGLPEIALPKAIEWLEELPLLGSGKVDHRTLAELASALVKADH